MTDSTQGTILIVDDTPTNLEMLFEFLSNSGFRILVAEDGESAIQKANYAAPDLILLDVLMPKMDGFETCRRLKIEEATKTIPVIFLTALSDTVDKVKGFEVGAVDYITKPLQYEEVLARVQLHLRLQTLTKQLQGQNRQLEKEIQVRQQIEQERLALLEREQIARREAEAVRNRVTNILESITDAFYTLDQQWRFTYLNPRAERMLQRTQAELLGQCVWDEFPEAVHSRFYQEYHRAVAEQVSISFEEFYPPLNGWFEVHAYPLENGLSVYFQDISDRKQAETALQRQIERSQLFAEVALKIRQSLQLEEILQTTATELQRVFQFDRALILRLFPQGNVKVVIEAHAPEVSSVIARNITDDCFGPEYLKKYRLGRVYSIADVETAQVDACLIDFLKQFNIRAKLVVPILLKQELWGLLIAHQCNQPRQWSQFEIELLQQLSDQIGIALAQAQMLEQEILQRQELARSNAELQQFAYIASHDLQEPLRMVTSYLQLLKRRYQSKLDADADEFIAYAVDGATRMKTLIKDLLQYSRVGTRGEVFQLTSTAAAVERALANLALAIEENQATITCEPLPEVMADAVQITQLFQNLISNAIKFRSQAPPCIQIKAEHQKDEWRFSVQDNGIGIDPEYADRIFVIFQRLHSRAAYPGTGIGLAICKKIVERHGGRIWFSSKLGAGSTFFFTIPDQMSEPL